MVGDAMLPGISGGQKKRVTTGSLLFSEWNIFKYEPMTFRARNLPHFEPISSADFLCGRSFLESKRINYVESITKLIIFC